jgi:hypothetical protein
MHAGWEHAKGHCAMMSMCTHNKDGCMHECIPACIDHSTHAADLSRIQNYIRLTHTKLHTPHAYKITYASRIQNYICLTHTKLHMPHAYKITYTQIEPSKTSTNDVWTFELHDVTLRGDVTIRLFMFEKSQGDNARADLQYGHIEPSGSRLRYGNWVGKEIAFVSIHTSFVDDSGLGMVFEKPDVDVAYKKSSSDFSPE